MNSNPTEEEIHFVNVESFYLQILLYRFEEQFYLPPLPVNRMIWSPVIFLLYVFLLFVVWIYIAVKIYHGNRILNSPIYLGQQ
jgi:hypothetical protein